jgi:hypothetical protein
MNFHLRINQVAIKCTPSTCQTMAPQLQVDNKELGYFKKYLLFGIIYLSCTLNGLEKEF